MANLPNGVLTVPNQPSTNALNCALSLYRYIPVQDADGGNDPANCYAGAADATAACSAQNTGTNKFDTDFGRAGSYNTWLIFVNSNLAVKRKDKLVLTLPTETHSVYVIADTDGGSRGASWQMSAGEYL